MRVYRFKDLFGNFGSLSMLKSSIRNDTVPNFILMSGESGTGKSSSAEILSLALTCENRVGEEPCLECDTCKRNILALQDKGISNRVKKVNLGLKNNKEDIDRLISEVFRLERSEGKTVFILEEVHSLDEIRQTSLLEEIDKLDKNVYVILCTTKPMKLLEELKNRAITFRFSNLKSSDSKLLLEKLLMARHISFSEDIKNLILKKSRGVPRTIVNLTEFIVNNSSIDYQALLDFLGEINVQLFALLFQSASDLNSYYISLQDLISKNTIYEIIYSMKSYLMDLQFLSKGVTTYHSHLTRIDKSLAESLGSSKLYKMQTVLHSLDYRCQEADFLFAMLKIRAIICSQDSKPSVKPTIPSEPALGNSRVFGASAIENHLKSEEKRQSFKSTEESLLTELNSKNIREILGR